MYIKMSVLWPNTPFQLFDNSELTLNAVLRQQGKLNRFFWDSSFVFVFNFYWCIHQLIVCVSELRFFNWNNHFIQLIFFTRDLKENINIKEMLFWLKILLNIQVQVYLFIKQKYCQKIINICLPDSYTQDPGNLEELYSFSITFKVTS